MWLGVSELRTTLGVMSYIGRGRLVWSNDGNVPRGRYDSVLAQVVGSNKVVELVRELSVLR